MMLGDRRIWEGKDPLVLYPLLTSALGTDPDLLLARCESEDEEVHAEAVAQLGERIHPLFQAADQAGSVAAFLRFMRWVDKITLDYQALADIGYAPESWWDVTGLWFNRKRIAFRQLWVTHRALYLALKELPLPIESYRAMTCSEVEAEEMQYDEQTDQVDRAIVSKT